MSITNLAKLNFSIIINAPVSKVWSTMLELETYKIWTAEFEPTSTFEGNWEQGSTIKFTSEGNSTSGLIGKIKENRPHEFVSIEYIGFIKDANIDTESPEAVEFLGAHEDYTYTALSETQTKLEIEVDASPVFQEYMGEAWPRALDKLKQLCEK